jgi:hypothetical protein
VTKRRNGLPLALLVVVLAVTLSGCLTAFPAKTLLSTDPRAASIDYGNVLVYEREQDPTTFIEQGSDARGIYVPERSQRVTVSVFAKITPAPSVVQPYEQRHFDLTVKDGADLVWVEIHLKQGDILKDFVVDGPRPGGWTVVLSYTMSDFDVPPARIDDQFKVQIIVRQPV